MIERAGPCTSQAVRCLAGHGRHGQSRLSVNQGDLERESMLGKLALPAIRELIELGDDDTLREALNRWLPADLAELVDALWRRRASPRACG